MNRTEKGSSYGSPPLKGALFGILFAALSTTAMGYTFSVQWSDLPFLFSREAPRRVVAQEAPEPKNDLIKDAVNAPIDAPFNDGRLDDERTLLDAARSALTQMALGHATAKLREHKQRFPEGKLSEEREALTVWRIAQEGDSKRTQAAVESFLERYPDPSRHRDQVKTWQEPID